MTYIPDREIISIHIGQAGIQLGNAIWEMLIAEHQILANGTRSDNRIEGEKYSTFFRTSHQNKCVPRALFLDLEPTVVDEIRCGRYRDLYHPDNIINGIDDASNNFARGYYTTGSFLTTRYTHQLRKLVEECEHLQGIMIIHSQGGGTGSGLCSKVFEHVGVEFGKLTKLEFPIYPAPHLSNAVVEPYNAVLNSHFCMEHSDVSLLMDNEALYQVCMRYLNVDQPTYTHINRIIAHLASNLTCSIRFDGPMRADLAQIQTNLVPYPRIHFPMCSFAPLLSHDRSCHEELTVAQITRLAYDPNCQFIKVETDVGKFMSCCLLYRGDVTPRDVNEAIMNLKRDRTMRFVDWCPTAFKVSINSQPNTMIPESDIAASARYVAMVGNNTAVTQAFTRIITKFDMLYQKRSFVHWYVGEGLEESEFSESVDNVRALARDYEECSIETGPDAEGDAEGGEEQTNEVPDEGNEGPQMSGTNEQVQDTEMNQETSALDSDYRADMMSEDIGNTEEPDM